MVFQTFDPYGPPLPSTSTATAATAGGKLGEARGNHLADLEIPGHGHPINGIGESTGSYLLYIYILDIMHLSISYLMFLGYSYNNLWL